MIEAARTRGAIRGAPTRSRATEPFRPKNSPTRLPEPEEVPISSRARAGRFARVYEGDARSHGSLSGAPVEPMRLGGPCQPRSGETMTEARPGVTGGDDFSQLPSLASSRRLNCHDVTTRDEAAVAATSYQPGTW